MLNFMKIMILCLGVANVCACGGKGWFRDRSNDYTEAKAIPELKIPKDTHSGSFSQEYEIPGT